MPWVDKPCEQMREQCAFFHELQDQNDKFVIGGIPQGLESELKTLSDVIDNYCQVQVWRAKKHARRLAMPLIEC